MNTQTAAPPLLTLADRRTIRRETLRLNPPAYFLLPYDGLMTGGGRRGGHVRLKAAMPGTDARTAPLILRAFARTRQEGDRLYREINAYLASLPDWAGIQSADRGEDVPLTLDEALLERMEETE